MKTKEFIKLIEDVDFTIEDNDGYLYVSKVNQSGYTNGLYGRVSKKHEYCFDTNYILFAQLCTDIRGLITTVLYAYSQTPIAERESIELSPAVLSEEWIEDNTFVVTDEDGDDYAVVENRKLKDKLVPKHELSEVLSQEWIEGNTSPVDDEGRLYIWKRDLENLIIPKQKLPVVPKYVGDWITKHRGKYDLYPALKELEDSTSGWERTYKWYRMNTHKFVNAYLTGEYEVEEEPLYHALVKGHELMGSGDTYWIYDKSDDSVLISKLYTPSSYFLTEMSKEDWSKLGINDSNSDFVRVDGVEE